MRRIAATIVSGALCALSFPPWDLGALSWIALTPFLLALRGRGPLVAAALAGLLGWAITLGVIVWLVPTLHGHFEQSLGFSVAFWLLFGMSALSPYYAALIGLYAWAARALPRWSAPLVFAAAWAGAEYARTQLGFRSPWTRLGDAQIDSVWLRQIADLTGVYGVSALVALGNAVVAELLLALADRRRDADPGWRRVAPGTAAFAILLGASLAYGAWRVRTLEAEDSAFEVALVQGNVPAELRWRRTTAARVIHRYGGLTRDLLRENTDAGPDLVVWPENAIQTSPEDPVYGPPLRGFARYSPLLIGAPREELRDGRRHRFNSAMLIGVDGVLGHYDKRRLLPFSETKPLGALASFGQRGDLDVEEYTPGDGAGIFDVRGERVGALICMEALYPELAREAALAGATLLVVLSNDGWYAGRGGAAQHLAMVRYRAIETRLPLLRATSTGISAVVRPNGEVAAWLGEGETGVLRSRVPVRAVEPSVYTRVGDAFALGCFGVTLLAAQAGRRRGGAARRAHGCWLLGRRGRLAAGSRRRSAGRSRR